MKKLLFLFLALITVLSACNEETVSSSSENAQSDGSIEGSSEPIESSTVSEESREMTLEEKFPDHNIDHIINKVYLATRKGNFDGDTDQYIIDENGRIIETFCCNRIKKVSNNKTLLYVVMSDGTAFFINEVGVRTENLSWDSLVHWEEVDGSVLLGKRGGEYFALDSKGKTVQKISTEPEPLEEYDGLTIAKAFRDIDWFYGVMKDGEFIIEPQFWDMPIIKKGKIVVNGNALDVLSSEGYIYDYSGKLVKKIYGHFAARNNFNYIIECERNDKDSEDATYSILDYSGEKLYTAPTGTTIGLAYETMWSPEIMPYHVMLNNEMIHLEKLIDGIEYPPVTVEDFKNAYGIDPENATVIQTPYLNGNTGRRYEVTDELKEYVKEKLISYLDLANIEYEESDITYVEDEGTFFAKLSIPNSVYNVLSYPHAISRSIADSGDSCEPLTDPLSDPIVRQFCEFTFKTAKGLRVEKTSNSYIIFEERNSVDKNALSIAQRSVVVYLEPHGGFCTGIYAVDMSDENVYQTHTLDAISYDEAVKEFRNGNYTIPPYSLIEIDYEKGIIEGVEFDYILITDCECKECYDIGYYIPCYCINMRDKDSPQYHGDVYVPAIDLDELNELLSSKGLPRVDHYWTED